MSSLFFSRSSGPIAAAVKPDAYSFTDFRSVAQLRHSPPTAENPANGISGFHPSYGSEYHLLAADSPGDFLANVTSSGSEHPLFASSGSELPLLAAPADIPWTDLIAAIDGHSESGARSVSAGNSKSTPSATMAGGICFLY